MACSHFRGVRPRPRPQRPPTLDLHDDRRISASPQLPLAQELHQGLIHNFCQIRKVGCLRRVINGWETIKEWVLLRVSRIHPQFIQQERSGFIVLIDPIVRLSASIDKPCNWMTGGPTERLIRELPATFVGPCKKEAL